jgi:hypothetical protein
MAGAIVGRVVVPTGTVGHRLQRHGVVELQGIGSWHRRSSADGVQQARQGGASPCRGEGGGGRRTRRSTVCWGEDATSCVDHPVGHLTHAEARSMAELLLLLLTWVRMIGVTMKPGFEVVGGLLG